MKAVRFFANLEKVAETGISGTNKHTKVFAINNKTVGSSLQMNFSGKNGPAVSIGEVEVFGKTVN